MKKALVLFALVAVCTGVTNAQNEGQRFRMGFKVNPNISWMQPQDKHFENESAVVRFGFGFVADIFFSENYAIGTGVNIMRNGGEFSYLQRTRFEDNEYIIRRTQNFNNQYVEIPLTFKLRTNEIGYITYWGQFGFGAAVNIASRGDDMREYLYEKVTADGSVSWQKIEPFSQTEENSNFSDELQLFRLSMIIAGGIEYNLSGSTSILVGFTFNNGFTNMFAKQDVIRTDLGDPVFEGVNPREDVRLRAIANSLELNLGILF